MLNLKCNVACDVILTDGQIQELKEELKNIVKIDSNEKLEKVIKEGFRGILVQAIKSDTFLNNVVSNIDFYFENMVDSKLS